MHNPVMHDLMRLLSLNFAALEKDFALFRSITPEIVFINVVLPAPFAPRIDTIRPGCTSKDTPRIAMIGP